MNLENINYVFVLIAGGLSLLGAVFWAGYFFNRKIKKACAEENQDLIEKMGEQDKNMSKMLQRMETLEKDTLKKDEHDRDMKSVCQLLTEVKTDVREGLDRVNNRFDILQNTLLTKKDA